MKKLLSLVLVIVLAFSLSTAVLAGAETAALSDQGLTMDGGLRKIQHQRQQPFQAPGAGSYVGFSLDYDEAGRTVVLGSGEEHFLPVYELSTSRDEWESSGINEITWEYDARGNVLKAVTKTADELLGDSARTVTTRWERLVY